MNFLLFLLQNQVSETAAEIGVSAGNAVDLVTEKLDTWLQTFIEMLPNLVVAVVVLLAFILVARLLKKLVTNLLGRTNINESISTLITTTVYLAVLLVGVFVALGILELDKTVTSLLAGAGIIGLALGFAFQDIAANFISGIIIAFRRPFQDGDFIESNEIFGRVVRVSLRTTVIQTVQGQEVLIPNKDIFQNVLKNFSRWQKRRIDLPVGVSYGEDLEKVKRVTEEAIRKIDYLLPNTEVQLVYTEFGDSSINFEIRYWIKFTGQVDYKVAVSDGIMNIKKAYDANDIMIPFPIRTLDFGIKGGEKFTEMLKEQPVQIRKLGGEQ